MTDCSGLEKKLADVAGMASIIADRSPDWWKIARPYVRDIFEGIVSAYSGRTPSSNRPLGRKPPSQIPKKAPLPPKKNYPETIRKPPFPRRDPPSPSARRVPQAKNNDVPLNRAKPNSRINDAALGIGRTGGTTYSTG